MDVPRLGVVGGSMAVAVLAVVLATGATGPSPVRRVLVFWTVVTFLVVGLVLWARARP